MAKLKKILKATRKDRWLFMMGVQALIILVLICILKREALGSVWAWIEKHTNVNLVVTLVATVLGGLIVKWIIEGIAYLRFYTRPYLTFEADNTQVFHLSEKVDGLEYSVGEKGWEELGTQSIVFGGERGKLLMRGKSDIGTGKATVSFASNAEVVCSGDIRTLVDYKHYNSADTSHAAYERLFQNCKQLVVAPELPACALCDRCYSEMFSGCTSLKAAPELPAQNLADYCYLEMFSGCVSLEVPPVLPAESLSKWCYAFMFEGCSSLLYAPKLPAENLNENCYANMFFGCTSLIHAPELPAEVLADGCYSHMFSGCTALKIVPELSSKTLAPSCYLGMYTDCTSLEDAAELPAMKLASFCYTNMFFGCTSLEHAPVLPAKILSEKCYSYMFEGCRSLSRITIMATKNVTKDCCKDWLEGTASSGTFFKNENAKWNENGIVPQGWTVEKI